MGAMSETFRRRWGRERERREIAEREELGRALLTPLDDQPVRGAQEVQARGTRGTRAKPSIEEVEFPTIGQRESQSFALAETTRVRAIDGLRYRARARPDSGICGMNLRGASEELAGTRAPLDVFQDVPYGA